MINEHRPDSFNKSHFGIVGCRGTPVGVRHYEVMV